MRDFDDIYNTIFSTLSMKGIPAAVRVITRIYEESDRANPWASFNMGSSVAAVHIARWTLGHDKTGAAVYPPKSVTDERFKKLVASHLPPGEGHLRLVMAIAIEHIPQLVRIIQHEDEPTQETPRDELMTA